MMPDFQSSFHSKPAMPLPSSRTPRLAFVTGASSGIGQAIALLLLKQGWSVALCARRVDAVRLWAANAGMDMQRIHIVGADVRDANGMAAAGAALISELGVPDAVFACAGISVGFDNEQLSDLEQMRAVFETNNLGMAATFQPFIGPMRARGSGRLVGISSIAAYRGLPGHGAYSASKAAVLVQCESLRSELSGSGVKVVAIAPGYIDTPLTRGNPYPMPFLMPVDAFARRAVEAMERGDAFRAIPWQMGWVGRLLRALPNWAYDAILAKRSRKARAPSP